MELFATLLMSKAIIINATEIYFRCLWGLKRELDALFRNAGSRLFFHVNRFCCLRKCDYVVGIGRSVSS